MKKLGIIGGLGPLATAYFYRRVVELTPACCDQEHIETWIGSCPQVPDRTAYLLAKRANTDDPAEAGSNDSALSAAAENPLPKMVEVGRTLRDMGAEVLAIPCITAHAFHSEMEKGIGLPVIHAIRELGEVCRARGITALGIMATDGARTTAIYDDTLSEYGIKCIWPSEEGQKAVMSMIYDDVKAGKEPDGRSFTSVSQELSNAGAQAIVLGCTELSQADIQGGDLKSKLKTDLPTDEYYIDIIDVLAAACVRECMK